MLNKVAFWWRTFAAMPIPSYCMLIIWLANGTVEFRALILLILIQVWVLAIWVVDLIQYITRKID